MEEIVLTQSEKLEKLKQAESISNSKNKPKQKPTFNFVGCNNCHKTNVTLIKATDSYYCINCFNELHKEKFKKGGK